MKAQTQAALQEVEFFKSLLSEAAETPAESRLRAAAEERTLAVLEGRAPVLPPEQERFIEELFGAERTKGQREIGRFLEETAASRGLRITDSPIASEAARAARELEEGLAGATARSKLDVGQAQQLFTENVRQFQEGLKIQAFQNRLALLGRAPPPGLPLFSTVSPAHALAGVTGALDVLGRERLAQATTKTSITKPFFDLTATDILRSATSLGGMALAGGAAT